MTSLAYIIRLYYLYIRVYSCRCSKRACEFECGFRRSRYRFIKPVNHWLYARRVSPRVHHHFPPSLSPFPFVLRSKINFNLAYAIGKCACFYIFSSLSIQFIVFICMELNSQFICVDEIRFSASYIYDSIGNSRVTNFHEFTKNFRKYRAIEWNLREKGSNKSAIDSNYET